jgi:hypothetical protein
MRETRDEINQRMRRTYPRISVLEDGQERVLDDETYERTMTEWVELEDARQEREQQKKRLTHNPSELEKLEAALTKLESDKPLTQPETTLILRALTKDLLRRTT